MPEPDHLFVYGTLKQGFPNGHLNRGRRVPGRFVTTRKWPLYLLGADHIPWLLEQPGEGHAVWGELVEVDAPTLALMDALERTDEPRDWYVRRRIEVQALDDTRAAPTAAWVYFGSATRWAAGPVMAGPLAEYTREHAGLYRHDAHDEVITRRAGPSGAG